MNIKIYRLNVAGRNIELVFGHARVRIDVAGLQAIFHKASQYRPALRCNATFKEIFHGDSEQRPPGEGGA